MVFCTEFLDGWWSWEPLRRSCVHLMLLMMPCTAPSAPHTRPTQRLSRPPPIQKLGAEYHMLQLNIWCSWWWAYVPETCRAKDTSIKLPSCFKLAFHIISCGRCMVKQPSKLTYISMWSPILFSGFNQIWNLSTHFRKVPNVKFRGNPPRWYTPSDRQLDGLDEINRRFLGLKEDEVSEAFVAFLVASCCKCTAWFVYAVVGPEWFLPGRTDRPNFYVSVIRKNYGASVPFKRFHHSEYKSWSSEILVAIGMPLLCPRIGRISH